jgi:hypothetical protein
MADGTEAFFTLVIASCQIDPLLMFQLWRQAHPVVRLDTSIICPSENLCCYFNYLFCCFLTLLQRWLHFSVGFAASAG